MKQCNCGTWNNNNATSCYECGEPFITQKMQDWKDDIMDKI